MKSIYSTLLSIAMLLLLTKCVVENPSLKDDIEDANRNKDIAAAFTIADHHTNTNQLKKSDKVNNIILAPKEQAIETSMTQENWNSNKPTTRTAWTTASNAVTWVTEDRIGVYMQSSTGNINPYTDRYNVLHSVVASGALTAIGPPMYFNRPYNSSNNTTFYAYYPYSSNASTNSMIVNYSLPNDQSSQALLASADIMSAKSSPSNGSSANITLPFNHNMVLLSFQIKGTLTLLTSATLTKIQLSGAAITNSGALDLKTNILNPNTSNTFSPFVSTEKTIKLNQPGNVDITVNPFSVSNNLGSELLITLKQKSIT